VIGDLVQFLMPAVDTIRASRPFHMVWPRNGPWVPGKGQFV
jgi:hypothetical protein